MNRIFLTVLLISILSIPAFSQEADSIRALSQEDDSISHIRRFDSTSIAIYPDLRSADTLVREDSVEVMQPDFSHSPSKAIMFALVLPGLGQAYNKKYFKMPLVWAAFGALGYSIAYTTKEYQKSSGEYALNPDELNERYIRYWRRNVELSYIGLIAAYALQVVDAYVDAQLYSWDVSENLSMRVAPSLQPLMVPASLTGQSYGFTCRLNLKGR